MSKSSTYALVILVLVFLLGLLSGIIGHHVWLVQHFEKRPPRDFPRMVHDGMNRFEDQLAKDLNLSQEQQEQIRLEIEKNMKAVDAFHKEMRPKFESLMQEQVASIEKHLTPEQVELYRELTKKRFRFNEHPMPGGPMPGPGGPRPDGRDFSRPDGRNFPPPPDADGQMGSFPHRSHEQFDQDGAVVPESSEAPAEEAEEETVPAS